MPARTDTRWFHDVVWDAARHRPRPGVEVRFIKGRLKFGGTGPAENSAPFPSVAVIFHPMAEDMPDMVDARGVAALRAEIVRLNAEIARGGIGVHTSRVELDHARTCARHWQLIAEELRACIVSGTTPPRRPSARARTKKQPMPEFQELIATWRASSIPLDVSPSTTHEKKEHKT